MAFKVSTKGGDTYKASEVEHAGPFVQMKCWNGEIRIPTGEVAKIQTTGMREVSGVQAWLIVFLIALIFWLMLLI
jgi:hypothetical protein